MSQIFLSEPSQKFEVSYFFSSWSAKWFLIASYPPWLDIHCWRSRVFEWSGFTKRELWPEPELRLIPLYSDSFAPLIARIQPSPYYENWAFLSQRNTWICFIASSTSQMVLLSFWAEVVLMLICFTWPIRSTTPIASIVLISARFSSPIGVKQKGWC